jgi:hypothetical protein
MLRLCLFLRLDVPQERDLPVGHDLAGGHRVLCIEREWTRAGCAAVLVTLYLCSQAPVWVVCSIAPSTACARNRTLQRVTVTVTIAVFLPPVIGCQCQSQFTLKPQRCSVPSEFAYCMITLPLRRCWPLVRIVQVMYRPYMSASELSHIVDRHTKLAVKGHILHERIRANIAPVLQTKALNAKPVNRWNPSNGQMSLLKRTSGNIFFDYVSRPSSANRRGILKAQLRLGVEVA